MAKIYEALEQARRQQADREASQRITRLETYARQAPRLDLEAEMIGLFYAIDALLPDTGAKFIQFIGSCEGEGTSTVARAFARVSSAQINKSVCLLETDARQLEQHHSSDRHPEHSVELLMQGEDGLEAASYELVESRLVVCPIAKLGVSQSGVLSSLHIDSYIDKLKQQFDLILVDSLPVTVSADGLAIVRKVDGVVLVVEAENTRWPVVQSVKDRIIKARGNLLGIVFNKRQYHIPPFLYNRL